MAKSAIRAVRRSMKLDGGGDVRIDLSSGIEAVARDLLVVELDAEAGAAGKVERARADVELRGDDVVAGLQRPDAFEAFDHRGAGRRQHDFGDRVDAQAEAVPDHD